MALLEALTLGIGASVAKATIKLWLGDSTLVSVSANSVVDVLKKYIEDFSARRTTERVFDDLRDEVARRLQPVIEVEFRDLAENDQVAAVYAVAQVFDGFSFDENLLKLDLDATRLETELNAPAEAAFRTLGDSPEKLAKLLLRECCNYVVRLAQAMPKVQAAATHEILKREREMMNVLTSMLDQLAAMRNTAANVGPAEAQSFELQYRRALVNKLDRLDLFGLRMIGGGAREYPLSVAYVRLSATHTGAGHSGRVDQILGQQQYVLIRGEAGSGKTTLMQWLAVRCASRELTGALQEWNDRIPYYVRLRDYARGVEVSFPTPEELLRGAGKNLASEQPHGWVHKALRANGLLLIDGVDELPAARRNAFGQWLRELRQDFSASAIVLSSRPTAVDARLENRGGSLADELQLEGFTSITLEPMSLQDSDALIAQWHAAVGREREADRALLVEYARELRNALNERSAIRNLATNPLLCAMLCALNWDRRKSLPNDRMLLYQLALDMLLEGRDAEREVQGARVRIEKSDKEALLDAIAYWMMRNGYAEADLDGVLDEVARQLPRLSRIPKSVTPELIVQELLERSGVLRQPQHGIIDFIHRTFLEYMGARAAVRAGDAGLLQGKARDESWRETIVFAVGHATGRERDELVRGLLKKRLWGSRPLEAAVLLACCLETAAQSLEPLLLLELRTIAKQLFPPRDLETAPLLAHAAAIDPDVLEGHSELVHVAACIRIAAIVGGSRMLNVIAGYAHIEPVEGEIVNAWDAYDQDVFVEVVLRNRATLLGISLADLDGQDFSCLRFLVGMGYQRSGGLESLLDEFRRTRSLDVSIERRIPGLAAIGSPTVSRLGLADVKRLARLSSLRALTIEIQGDLLHPLGALENLEELHVRIAGPPQAISLAPFLACKRLKTLIVSGATLLDVEVLVALSSLNRLQLLSCDGIRNRSLASLSQLMELVLDGEDWPLELELPVNLVRLGARHGAGSRRLQARGGPVRLQTMHRLQALDADESTMEYGRFAHLLKQVTITSVDPLPVSISVSTSCESLMLRVPIVDFLSLRHHANLESIDLSQVGEVRDPKSLFTLPRLKALVVSSARPVINDSVMSLLKARGVQVTSA